MRIVVDQDQVLCAWVERIIQWYNEDKGTSYTREDIKNWNVKMNLGPHSEDFLRSCMRYPEFYRDLDPIEGAISGMRKLVDAGHDVVIATVVPKCAGMGFHGKMEWLRRNMPWFKLENFIAIHRKELLAPWADLLLDDGLHNIVPFNDAGKTCVIMDCPWNQAEPKYSDPSLIHRVRHWNEFLDLVKELEKK